MRPRTWAHRLDEFQATEFYARLRHFAPVDRFLQDNAKAIAGLSDELRRQTGLASEELVRRLLGRQVLVAVWPGTARQEIAPGPALLLLDCQDAPLLKDVMTHVMAAEDRARRKVAKFAWREAGKACTIYRVDTGAGQPPLFVAAIDTLGVVATEQSLIEQVLTHRVAAAAAESLADLPSYRAAQQRLNPRAFARLFVNPRSWERALAGLAAEPSSGAGGTLGRLAEQFRTADYCAISCELGENVVVEGFLQRITSAGGAAPSDQSTHRAHADLAERLPARAAAAFAGRVDLPKLLSTFFHESSQSPTGEPPLPDLSHDALARQALATLLAERGYETVAALVIQRGTSSEPADQTERAALHPATSAHWVVGFDTHSLLPDDRPAFGERLNPLLRSALTAAVMLYNRPGQSVRFDSAAEQGVPLTTVDGLSLLGQGDTATFSLLKGFFWAGTCRHVVRDAARLEVDQSLAADRRFQTLANPRVAGRTHLAYFDLAALRPLLAQAALPADAHSATTSRGNDLLALMGLADRLLVEVQIDESGLGLSISAATDAARLDRHERHIPTTARIRRDSFRRDPPCRNAQAAGLAGTSALSAPYGREVPATGKNSPNLTIRQICSF